MRWVYLGELPYEEALALQLRLRQRVGEGEEETLLLLQHPPVVTLGRSANPTNVLLSDDALAQMGIAKVQASRGGDVTYHGPGQLVGYPIRRIGRAVSAHVEAMTTAVIELLGGYGIDSWWEAQAPGVWTSNGKIAAVGVDAREQVAIHGFSLNVDPQLKHYEVIIPCGLSAPVTSLAALMDTAPKIEDVVRRIVPLLGRTFGCQMVDWTGRQL